MRQVAHRAAHEGSAERSRDSILALNALPHCSSSLNHGSAGAFRVVGGPPGGVNAGP